MKPQAQASIVIIENDEEDVIRLRMALARLGATCPVEELRNEPAVREYFSPGGAIERGVAARPALVLMCAALPGMALGDLLALVRGHAAGPQVEVVLLAEYFLEGDLELANKSGVAQCLTKPVLWQALLRVAAACKGLHLCLASE